MSLILQGVGASGSVGPTSGGKVSAASPKTVPATVVAGNPARQSITFANPGSVAVFVYPTINAAGGPNSPSAAAPQGSFQILPGGLLTISGECQLSWGAFVGSVTGALTIMEVEHLGASDDAV
jgi:hypothetical protein